MTESRLVRVELEFADGMIKRLTGEDAEEWLEKVNSVITLTACRYGQDVLPEFPWEIERQTEASDG